MNRPTPDRRRHNEKAAQSVIPVAAVLEGVHLCFAVTRTESNLKALVDAPPCPVPDVRLTSYGEENWKRRRKRETTRRLPSKMLTEFQFPLLRYRVTHRGLQRKCKCGKCKHGPPDPHAPAFGSWPWRANRPRSGPSPNSNPGEKVNEVQKYAACLNCGAAFANCMAIKPNTSETQQNHAGPADHDPSTKEGRENERSGQADPQAGNGNDQSLWQNISPQPTAGLPIRVVSSRLPLFQDRPHLLTRGRSAGAIPSRSACMG